MLHGPPVMPVDVDVLMRGHCRCQAEGQYKPLTDKHIRSAITTGVHSSYPTRWICGQIWTMSVSLPWEISAE